MTAQPLPFPQDILANRLLDSTGPQAPLFPPPNLGGHRSCRPRDPTSNSPPPPPTTPHRHRNANPATKETAKKPGHLPPFPAPGSLPQPVPRKPGNTRLHGSFGTAPVLKGSCATAAFGIWGLAWLVARRSARPSHAPVRSCWGQLRNQMEHWAARNFEFLEPITLSRFEAASAQASHPQTHANTSKGRKVRINLDSLTH